VADFARAYLCLKNCLVLVNLWVVLIKKLNVGYSLTESIFIYADKTLLLENLLCWTVDDKYSSGSERLATFAWTN